MSNDAEGAIKKLSDQASSLKKLCTPPLISVETSVHFSGAIRLDASRVHTPYLLSTIGDRVILIKRNLRGS